MELAGYDDDAQPKIRNSGGGRMARALARQVYQQYVQGGRPGDCLPSERELARRHHCSVKTVRAALGMLVEQGLVRRVRGSGTYLPDAPGFMRNTTGVLFFGHAYSLLRESYYREVLEGLLEATDGSSQEVHLLLGRKRSPAAVSSNIVDETGLERFNSVVCLEVFNQDLMESLAKRRPVVAVDFACHRPGVSSCVIDHAQTIDLAVEQLWRMGHRRVAYLGGAEHTSDPSRAERVRAFQQSMKARGLSLPPERMMRASATSDSVVFAELLAKMPAEDRVTGVVCVDLHWQLAETLVRFGVSVPRQISLVALGTPLPWLAQLLSAFRFPERDTGMLLNGEMSDPLDPRLTPLRTMVFSSVGLPFIEMGTWAMKEILRRLQDPNVEPEFKVFLGSFRPGNTIGPPPE